MKTAVRKKPAKPTKILLEDLVRSKPQRVDREAGILYHVKILGLESANGRRYTQEAIRTAAPLYEGRAVNVDHPSKPSDPRSAYDRFGWFERVTVEADGLYGDFHLVNPKTELAESLLNAAESKPDLYGFSHNALGEGDEVDGVFVVGRISEVRSVDLVAEPATTKSLFESRRTVKVKLRKLLETYLPKLSAKRQPKLKALLEAPMDDPMAAPLDMDAEMPAEPAADDGDWKSHLTNAIGALVSGDDPTNHDLAKKILNLLKPESASTETTTEEEDDEEEDDKEEEKPVEEGEDKDKEKDKDKMESLQREVTSLKADRAVRQLIEDAGIKFGKPEAREVFIESLLPLDEKKRKALIEERKGLLQESANGHNRPRSQGPGSGAGNGTRDAQLSKVSDSKSLAEALKRR